MQNRYVGDIGDYVKFAILRALMPGRKLGVAWWLYEDEDHNKNGRHIGYLDHPAKWRHYDPDLYDRLKVIVDHGIRHVKEIEASALLPGATFYNEVIPIGGTPADRRRNRISWFDGMKKTLVDDDLIFLDPDNGLETAGFSTGTKISGKSVGLAELVDLSSQGRALIVYHHQTRRKGGHFEELRHWSRRLEAVGFRSIDVIRSRSYSPRAFFLLNALPNLRERAERLVRRWNDLLSWHSYASSIDLVSSDHPSDT